MFCFDGFSWQGWLALVLLAVQKRSIGGSGLDDLPDTVIGEIRAGGKTPRTVLVNPGGDAAGRGLDIADIITFKESIVTL